MKTTLNTHSKSANDIRKDESESGMTIRKDELTTGNSPVFKHLIKKIYVKRQRNKAITRQTGTTG